MNPHHQHQHHMLPPSLVQVRAGPGQPPQQPSQHLMHAPPPQMMGAMAGMGMAGAGVGGGLAMAGLNGIGGPNGVNNGGNGGGVVVSNHSKKTTIHVTNIIKDKAELKTLFAAYDGFRRISFHQDYLFLCFANVETSTRAIDRIHNETDMLAAYAKHGVASNTTPSISVQPNPILYVSVFPYFSEGELMKIFKGYEGFDSCRFFPNHALVRFANVECSKRALEDLNSTTNLFANYSTKGAKSGTEPRRGASHRSASTSDHYGDPHHHNGGGGMPGGPGGALGSHIHNKSVSVDDFLGVGVVHSSSAAANAALSSSNAHPKCTIHVTNLDRDLPGLLDFLGNLRGFRRVAFYVDYAFVIFHDAPTASSAIEEILFGTKMKASFAKAEYSPHPIPSASLGCPNAIVRVSDYPPSADSEELARLFSAFEGFVDVLFYHSSCLVHFADIRCAHAALVEINATTNFTAIFSRKGALG
ncbi:hypothetical protein HK101_006360, partial [Irineochytrium annulatum]